MSTRTAQAFAMLWWLALALAAAWWTPPFSSPDEDSHLLRANMISQGQWRMEPAPATAPRALGGLGGQVDQAWVHYMLQAFEWQFSSDAMTRLVLGDAALHSPTSKQHLRQLGAQARWTHTTTFASAVGTNYYNPLIYAPHAAALWLARQLELSMAASYDAVRLATIVLCLALAGTALRLLAFPPIALGVVATPMALFQWYAPTIDGLTLGLTMLALALFLTEARRPAGQQRTARVCWLAGAVALVATTRIHLLPLLALPLWLALRQGQGQSQGQGRPWSATAWWPALAALAGTAAWLAVALGTTVDTRVQRQHSSLEIASAYLREPLAFAALLQRTLANAELQQFYVHSFIGNLGWLDTPVAPRHVLGIGLGLGVLLLASLLPLLRAGRRADRSGPVQAADPTGWTGLAASRALLLGIGLSSIVLAFLALAITWNDYPATVIEGLQGRYFTLPLFVAACALWDARDARGAPTAGRRRGAWVGAALLAAYVAYACSVTALTLMARYP